jgi:tyrosyl-DNA phosphodiesterase-1
MSTMFKVTHSAIALSLKEAQAVGTSSQPITIDDDSDDGDDSSEDARFNANLQRALALSNTEPSDAPKAPSSAAQSASAPAPPAATPTTAPFMSERAQMEQARLERLKRLRPDLAAAAAMVTPVPAPAAKRARASAPPSSSGSETESDSGAEGAPPRQRQRVSPPGAAPENGKGKGKAGADDGVLFWDAPELRQTANALVDRAKDTRPTWRLSEIIGPVSRCAMPVPSRASFSLGTSACTRSVPRSVALRRVAE